MMLRLKYLVWAAWFGLITGLTEVALLAVAKYSLHHEVHAGVDAVWMTPVADALIFSIPAILLLLLSFRVREALLTRVALAVFAFLGFISILLLYQRLHIPAAALLAAGLATQTVRLLNRYLDSGKKLFDIVFYRYYSS